LGACWRWDRVSSRVDRPREYLPEWRHPEYEKGEIESKFDEIVAFSEVEQFIDTPVKRYSSGMYLRLAFAVALTWSRNTGGG